MTMTLMKMSKKKSSNGNDDDVGRPRPTHRAWKLLRLALLWARKGGVFRRRLMMELRVVPKLLKSSFVHMLMHMQQQKQQQYYFERQLSFDKTPIFPTLKTKTSCSRSSFMCFINNIPCLNAPLALDYFDDDQVDMIINNHGYQSNDCRNCYNDDDDEDDASTARQSFLIKCDEKDDGRDIIQDDEEERVTLSPATAYKNNIYEELEESVDMKADEFIAKFYQQMKLQRQISYRNSRSRDKTDRQPKQ
ncbi:uncharacterized protein LOC103931989 isoform X2 [Pyrus x bretschneideri]|uniref:uncharacterized protein LOC103931989 isoform X1 n=1 Tax=Pyrus x bretschneideri TaxID=225117 RepID=UPI002030D09F|nr:uncharacterized protein LOC103931989 isoform X1 [Pyrus x bretschneideri]XP_048442924.1 uncharacterized protein LOC103931989 isoform X2 [Pyrus x bretschneideri]